VELRDHGGRDVMLVVDAQVSHRAAVPHLEVSHFADLDASIGDDGLRVEPAGVSVFGAHLVHADT
jgi:hypothetical protein